MVALDLRGHDVSLAQALRFTALATLWSLVSTVGWFAVSARTMGVLRVAFRSST